jgi:4-amino-4-deoxy-L-arabinose transferase-like glycosyltransferase
MKREMKILIVLLLLSLGVRLYAALHTPVISKDGTVYIQSAMQLAAGDFVAGMRLYPPVYPTLVAAGHAITGNAEAVAQGVSVVMGSLALLPFFALARSIFGTKIARVASLFFVFQPALVQHSGDALSEATYLFFFLAALNAGWKGWQEGRGKDYFLFGLCSALAYLTRPEGITLVAGMVAWIGLGLWRRRQTAPSTLEWKGVILGLLPIVLLTGPYLLHVRTTTGEWRINAKRDMFAASGLASALTPQPPATDAPLSDRSDPSTPIREQPHYSGFVETTSLTQFVGRYMQTFARLAIKYMEVVHPLLFFFILYLCTQRMVFSHHPEGESFLAGFCLVYLAILASLYVEGRHLLPLVPLLLPWAAAGLIKGAKQLKNFSANTRSLGEPIPIQNLLLVFVLIVLFPQTFAPHRADKLALREAAEWIYSQKGSSRILSTDRRVAYYAKGQHLQVRNIAKIGTLLRRYKPDWAVLEGEGMTPLHLPNTHPPFSIKNVFQTGEGPAAYRVIVYGTGQT